MLKTIYRISVMYFVSILLMRIAGKREVAQLEVSELVTSFMVSEIACMPITDPEVKLWHAIVFTLSVIVLEIIMTKASMHLPLFKRMVVGKPDFLVVKGQLDKKALQNADVSLTELVSAIRKNGVSSLDKVNYAVQESDGTISIFPFKENDTDKSGIQHMLICDGKLNKSEMKHFCFDEHDVERILREKGVYDISEVFFLGIDDDKNVFIIEK